MRRSNRLGPVTWMSDPQRARRFDHADASLTGGREIAGGTDTGGDGGKSATETCRLACCGRQAELEETGASLIRTSGEAGRAWLRLLPSHSSAIPSLSFGRHAEALDRGDRSSPPNPPQFGPYVSPNLVERRHVSAARKPPVGLTATLEERELTSGTALGVGPLARSRALAAEDDRAEPPYTEPLGQLERSNVLPALARGHVVYGEWLRRQLHPGEAGVQLAVAHDPPQNTGANDFAEGTRTKRRATGAERATERPRPARGWVRRAPRSSGSQPTALRAARSPRSCSSARGRSIAT
jgi:hypothetical protein